MNKSPDSIYSGAITIVILIIFGSAVLYATALWIKSKLDAYSYKPKDILTINETEFFHRLRRALPDHYIFPQVAFTALLEPVSKTQKGWRTGFFSISTKRVDFALYDADLRLVAIIELDDRTHDKAKDRERDAKFESAGIKTIRFESRNRPTESALRALFASPPAAQAA